MLMLAQSPPPLHGQSQMVKSIIEGLRRIPSFDIHHVDLRLSSNHAEIGRWRSSKVVRTLAAALRTILTQLHHRCDVLYYVPAPPGKRGALYRDWLVMVLCRPFFRHLVLHWQAAGLAGWLVAGAEPWERFISRLLLGRATLGLVLAEALREDAIFFKARKTVVLPNGVADPAPPPRPARRTPRQVLFLGLCSEEKGVFSAAEAVLRANQISGEKDRRFVAAGTFPDEHTAARFSALASANPDVVRHAGFVEGAVKSELLTRSDVLLFPTRYPAEAMPLVVLEALAHDVPIIATRWRAIPEVLSGECGLIVESFDPAVLARALIRLEESPPAAGSCRRLYLNRYSVETHLTRLAAALRPLAR